MTRHFREAMVVARRDFLAVVATPTFLLFLLAPLFMIGVGMIGGIGASGLADSAGAKERMVMVADPALHAAIRSAEQRVRATESRQVPGPVLDLFAPAAGEDAGAQARRIIADKAQDTLALAYGPLERPTIMELNDGGRSGRFLASLAEQTLRERELARPNAARSTPRFEPITAPRPSNSGRQLLGFAAVFGVFLLSLMLASQTVGMLAEEKTNKVIEILAASIPLEAVFFGKLIGMFGVSILFVAFWGALGLSGGSAIEMFAGGAAGTAGGAAGGAGGAFASLAPAVGWPVYLLLAFLYFCMAFMLLGSVFLAIGGLAATVREIQMLSLPITIFQVGMFGWASAAANLPGSALATAAQIFPFSSPFAMAARSATDAALWPHLAALLWQALWVAVMIWLGVRLFRIGVLKSSVDWQFWKRAEPRAGD